MKRGRLIEVETETLVIRASTKVVLETPLVDATGEIKDQVRTMQQDRDLYNEHVHGNSPKPAPRQ